MKKVSKIRLSKCSISSQDILAVTNALKTEYLGHGSFVVEFEKEIKSLKSMNSKLFELQKRLVKLEKK